MVLDQANPRLKTLSILPLSTESQRAWQHLTRTAANIFCCAGQNKFNYKAQTRQARISTKPGKPGPPLQNQKAELILPYKKAVAFSHILLWANLFFLPWQIQPAFPTPTKLRKTNKTFYQTIPPTAPLKIQQTELNQTLPKHQRSPDAKSQETPNTHPHKHQTK